MSPGYRALPFLLPLLLMIGLALPLALAPPVLGQPRVQVVNGLVTARLVAVPVAEAVAAIKQSTGLEVVLPATTQGKTVTVDVEDLPFERFIRRLLDQLDVGGYALVYESGGESRRLLVVESARATPPPPATASAMRPAGPSTSAPWPPSSPLGSPPTHAVPVVEVAATGITITARGQYDRLDLTVAGRDGPMIRRQYRPNAAAYFDVLDEQGQPLRDGSYRYELVVVPSIPDAIRQRMESVRESPDDRYKLERELREQGWLPKEPIIHSGHFSVAGGMIMDGSAPEGSARRR
jgi:hypothetical protein